jgi:spermidine synthase
MTISDRKGRVLLAGEASYDILRHIIEHKPLEVDYIEYDRGLSELTRKYITNLQIDSSSVRLINDDARRFIQSVSNRYDLIILDIPEPENLQLNRYFTVEFFDASKRSLKEGGILIFSLPSIASQASFSKTEFLISVYSAVKEVFSNVIPLSFEKIYVFASDAPISIDLETLIERFRGYNLNCDFEPELMSLALDDYNNQRVLKILTSKVLNPNRDKNPYALFASLMLYEMSSNNKGESVLFYIRWIKLYHICIFFFLIFIVVSISRKKSVVTGTLMASQGFVSMSLEIMVIYLFQIRYGVLYQYMAMLFAIFMLGLGAGSLFFKKYKFSCALLPSINILVSLFLLFFNPEISSFFALLLIDGLVTGVYFGHLSASLVDAEDRSVVRSASVMDFADSFGAMLAGFFLPIVFLPLYNFSNTLIVLIILSALSIVLHTMAKLSGTER